MRRRVGCAGLVLGLALAVAGCGSTPELDADRAHTLQQSVLGVTQAAAEGRWADAQALLATTRADLDAGADLGEVSTARYRQIDTALDEVESQLAAEQERAAAAAAAVPEPSPAAVSPAPAVVDTPATTPKGKDKGKGPGKGKGGK